MKFSHRFWDLENSLSEDIQETNSIEGRENLKANKMAIKITRFY